MAEHTNKLDTQVYVIKAKYCCDFRDCFFAAYQVYVQKRKTPSHKLTVIFHSYISRVKATKKCQDARDVASIEALADDYDKIYFDVVFNVLKNQIPC